MKNQARTSISLAGSDWHILAAGTEFAPDQLQREDWIPARVPGNIQADLEAAHVIGPLWYGRGDPRLAQVAMEDWWYRKDFAVPAELAGRRLRLVFDGVDHECVVWLNGRMLGRHAGMFTRFGFEVGDVIRPGETNRLEIGIVRMPEELAGILTRSDGKNSGGGKKSDDWFLYGINDTRRVLKHLKSPTNFGWDWGVNIYTLGIWQDVRLEATGPVRIEWLQVQASVAADHSTADVCCRAELDGSGEAAVRVQFTITGPGPDGPIAGREAVTTSLPLAEASITVQQPALWWPNGQGAQPLYLLRAEALDPLTGDLLDVQECRFGVRDIRWEQVQGAPADFVNPFQLVVNARPVRTIGSNIIPPDLLFGRMNERGPWLMRLAARAGINTLRVWGGGALLTGEMYDLADELGIMLVLEFPLANCIPEDDGVFLANLSEAVSDIVKRLRHHPSIIEWDGGNEMHWMEGDTYPALLLMKRLLSEIDDRTFRATCPIQGGRHGPWNYDPVSHYAHYDDPDIADRTKTAPMFRYGEFGCQTPANLEVWQREIPTSDQLKPDDTENPVLIRKNVAHAAFGEETYWLMMPVIESLFGRPPDLPFLVEAGQFLGAEGLRYAIDALRRRGPRIGGLTTWDYNEPWPNGAGSYLVDYDGRPLMNYDFARQAWAQMALSLRYSSITYDEQVGVRADLYLVSDRPEPVEGLRWMWTARDGFGQVLGQGQGSAAIRSQETLHLAEIRARPQGAAASVVLIELRLLERDGQLLTERVHLFGPRSLPAPLGGLLRGDIGRTTLHARATPSVLEGDRETFALELENQGAMTALFCEVHPDLAYRTDLMIEPNHVCIPPGEGRTVVVTATSRPCCGLSLAQTGWIVSCWNADRVVLPPSAEVLLAVGRYDAMTREYRGYANPSELTPPAQVQLTGARPDPSLLPYLLSGPESGVRFVFEAQGGANAQPARLRIHTADQDAGLAPLLEITVNGRQWTSALPAGLGVQATDPAHLAFPASAELDLPAGMIRSGSNTIDVRVVNASWFSWCSLDLVTSSRATKGGKTHA